MVGSDRSNDTWNPVFQCERAGEIVLKMQDENKAFFRMYPKIRFNVPDMSLDIEWDGIL